ncbi:MAG: hypothetical protein R3F46_04860 [bacterium]
MANMKNRGIAILTTLLLGLSAVVLGLLAETRPAHASEEDCLLLVLDSADGETVTAGITIQFVDREGETHTYETNENGLVLVPCGLLGDSLMFEDTWGHGFCMVLNPENAHEGPLNSLLIDHPELGIVSAPQASVTPYGTVLRLGLGPGSEDPVQS